MMGDLITSDEIGRVCVADELADIESDVWLMTCVDAKSIMGRRPARQGSFPTNLDVMARLRLLAAQCS
jgi:hypothetical protein